MPFYGYHRVDPPPANLAWDIRICLCVGRGIENINTCRLNRGPHKEIGIAVRRIITYTTSGQLRNGFRIGNRMGQDVNISAGTDKIDRSSLFGPVERYRPSPRDAR